MSYKLQIKYILKKESTLDKLSNNFQAYNYRTPCGDTSEIFLTATKPTLATDAVTVKD